jgi:hypothetical protein
MKQYKFNLGKAFMSAMAFSALLFVTNAQAQCDAECISKDMARVVNAMAGATECKKGQACWSEQLVEIVAEPLQISDRKRDRR